MEYRALNVGHKFQVHKKSVTDDPVFPSEAVLQGIQEHVETYLNGDAGAFDSLTFQVPKEQHSAAGVNIDELRNFVTYGFKNVRRLQQSSGTVFVSHDKDGKITDELIMADEQHLQEIRRIRLGMRDL